jgi:hypothetical protein
MNILPIDLYEHETWYLTLRKENILKASENRMLKRISELMKEMTGVSRQLGGKRNIKKNKIILDITNNRMGGCELDSSGLGIGTSGGSYEQGYDFWVLYMLAIS